MPNVLMWLNRRFLRERSIWLSFLLLAICSLVISGGVTRRYTLNLELGTLNTAYATSFVCLDDFREWFTLWQFQRLMGSYGHICLFAIATWIIPKESDPEITIPVSLGYRRSQLWFAMLFRFAFQIILLSLFCIIAGTIASSIHLAEGVTATYYLRCVGLHIWRDLGFAGLALAFVLILPKRSTGMCVSFGLMLCLSVLATSGYFGNTIFRVLLANLSVQDKLWLWQVNMSVPPFDAVVLFVFPIFTFGIASVLGLQRYGKDLR